MISVGTLYQLGYRICHAKNVGKAIAILKKVKSGAVTHDQIDQAIAALEHAPLSQSTAVAATQQEER